MAENWWLIIVVLLVIGIGLWWLVGRSDKPSAPPVDRKVEERPTAPPTAALAREPEPVVLSPKVADVPPAPVVVPVAKPVTAPKAKAAAPVAKAAPKAKATPKKTAAPKATPAAKAAPKKAAPVAKPAAAPKAAPKPKAKPSVPDDLLLVKGIGPKVAALLAGEGVTRFEQIAAWGNADIAAIDDKLGTFRGRPTRDKWVEQAGYLARGDRAGFEAKFGKLEG